MSDEVDDITVPTAPLRHLQERAIALDHSLTAAEHALTRDAVVVGLTLARAGIEFDPRTFVALRIVEGSLDLAVDPIECLRLMQARGVIERAVAATVDLLEDAA